jgi:ATP-dependent Clp protease protease subunit
MADLIVAQLLYLEREDPDKDISFYIHSPGGSAWAAFAIYDTMQLIRCDVSTICVGVAASAATILLCSGAKGKRYALPNSTIQMHQVQSGVQGAASDIAIAAKETLRIQEKLRAIISKHTGQPDDKVAKDTDRDFWLSAEQAVEYGLVDEILTREPKREGKDKH